MKPICSSWKTEKLSSKRTHKFIGWYSFIHSFIHSSGYLEFQTILDWMSEVHGEGCSHSFILHFTFLFNNFFWQMLFLIKGHSTEFNKFNKSAEINVAWIGVSFKLFFQSFLISTKFIKFNETHFVKSQIAKDSNFVLKRCNYFSLRTLSIGKLCGTFNTKGWK